MHFARLLFLGLAIGLFAGTSAPNRQEQGIAENVPADIARQVLLPPFSGTYDVSTRMNPFYLRGDFDGDGVPDYAMLIESKKSHLKGIGIWLSSRKTIIVLGAGQPFIINGSGSRNLDFLNTWQVYGKKPVEGGVKAGPPPTLVGEAILVGKQESASGLIYWNGKEFRWYQQGD